MTAVVPQIPDTVAAKVQRLRRAGHTAVVVPSEAFRSTLMPCRACDTNTPHYADVIVNVAFHTDVWTFPVQRLDGRTTPCCWRGLFDCLEEAEHEEMFEGVTIEVPTP
jgi:hypothetical protein